MSFHVMAVKSQSAVLVEVARAVEDEDWQHRLRER